MDISGLTVTSIFILLFSDVDCSMKKGLGFSVKLYQCDDLAAFTNIYWWYVTRLLNFFVVCYVAPTQVSSYGDITAFIAGNV